MRHNRISLLIGLALGAAASWGCAPKTVLIDGKQVPRETYKLTGNPYSVTHIDAHPRPGGASSGLTEHGGRITGPVCGNDIDYEVKHMGDRIELNGFIDAHFSSVIEVKEAGGERIISGNFGTGAGTSTIELHIRAEGFYGQVGSREFRVQQDGDNLVGKLRIGSNLLADTIIHGREVFMGLAPADQAAILPHILTCQGEWIRFNGNRKLEVTFGGPAGFSPANTSALYEFRY